MYMDISEQAVFPDDKENGFFLIKMIIEGDEGHMTAWLQRKR